MKTQDLAIQGMTCGHCIMAVKRELAKIPYLEVGQIDIGKARVRYDESRVTADDLARAIEEAGYSLAQ